MTTTTTLDELKEMMIILNKNMEKNNEKLDIICKKLDGEIMEECKKMTSHIDFVEEIYDNVKKPFHYLCDTVNGMTATKLICNDNLKKKDE